MELHLPRHRHARPEQHLILRGPLGKYVTLKATASRYSPNADAFRAWKGKPVTLSYKKCSSCGWQILKTRTTNSDGKVPYKVYASKARYWRVQTSDSSNTWGRTSATLRR